MKRKTKSGGAIGLLAIFVGVVIIMYALIGTFFGFSLGDGELPSTSSVLTKEITYLFLGIVFIKVGSYIRKKATELKKNGDTNA